MNAIMDLTARAISFITTIQTTLVKGAIATKQLEEKVSILHIEPDEFQTALNRFILHEEDINSGEYKNRKWTTFT